MTGAVGRGTRESRIPENRRLPLRGALLALVVSVVAVARLLGVREWPLDLTVNISDPVNALYGAIQDTIGSATAALATWLLGNVLGPLADLLMNSPWWLVVLAATALGWIFAGTRAAIVSGASLIGVGLLGVWSDAMDTLSQVLVASVITIALGVLIGVLMSRSDVLAAILRPILDAMQTLPPFVYLIPAVALFTIGRIPALVAAVVFALPPVIRLVNDGIRGVPAPTLEAARSQGSTRWQLLTKVELPLARGSMLLAVNQGIILVLSMVVIGALVGAGALGNDVVVGLAQNQLGLGLASGLAIVCLGLFLDRVTQGRRPFRA